MKRDEVFYVSDEYYLNKFHIITFTTPDNHLIVAHNECLIGNLFGDPVKYFNNKMVETNTHTIMKSIQNNWSVIVFDDEPKIVDKLTNLLDEITSHPNNFIHNNSSKFMNKFHQLKYTYGYSIYGTSYKALYSTAFDCVYATDYSTNVHPPVTEFSKFKMAARSYSTYNKGGLTKDFSISIVNDDNMSCTPFSLSRKTNNIVKKMLVESVNNFYTKECSDIEAFNEAFKLLEDL